MIQKSFTGKSDHAHRPDPYYSFRLGQIGENLALKFLMRKGYGFIQKNYRIRGGEIDLIMEKDGIIIFVEVKLRGGLRFGLPEESLTPLKIRRILRAIYHFRQNAEESDAKKPWRCDLIAIEMKKAQIAEVKHLTDIFSV